MGYGGWEGGSRGRGYGDIRIHIADSLCCTTETKQHCKAIILQSRYKNFFKKRNEAVVLSLSSHGGFFIWAITAKSHMIFLPLGNGQW